MPNLENLLEEESPAAPSQAQQEAAAAKKELEEFHAGPGSSIATAATGAAEAFLPIRSFLPDQERQYRARMEEYNKGAYIGGQLAGFLVGAASGTGVPGLAAGAGRSAAAKLTPLLGAKIGERAGEAIGKLAAGAVEGMGIGVSEATNKAGYDLITGVPGAGAAFFEAAGEGAAVGGAFAATGQLLHKGSSWLFGKAFGRQIKTMKGAMGERLKANQEYHKLLDEVEGIKAKMTPDQIRMMREFSMSSGSPSRYDEIMGAIGGAESRKGYTRTLGGKQPLMVKALRAMERADDKVSNPLNKAMKEAASTAQAEADGMLRNAIFWTVGGPKGFIMQKLLGPTIHAAQDFMYEGAARIPVLRKMLTASLMESAERSSKTRIKGALTYKKLKVADKGARYTYDRQRHDALIEDMLSAVGYSVKIPTMSFMTSDDFNDIADEIDNANIGEFELGLRMGLGAQGVPQEFASPVVAQQVRFLDHMKQHMPPRHPPDWIAGGSRRPVPDRQRLSFARRYRAGMAPFSVISDFLSGKLTPEAAQSFWAVHPLMAGQFADAVLDQVAVLDEMGYKFSEKQKKMIGLMVDPSGQKIGRQGNVSLVQSLQMNYANEDAQNPPPQVGGPKPPGDPGAFAGSHQNVMDSVQQLTNRAMRRA